MARDDLVDVSRNVNETQNKRIPLASRFRVPKKLEIPQDLLRTRRVLWFVLLQDRRYFK